MGNSAYHEWETPEVSGVRNKWFIDLGPKLIPSARDSDNTSPTSDFMPFLSQT